MNDQTSDATPRQDTMAELERHLIQAYLTGAGQDLHALTTRDDAESRRLLAAASQYASSRLSEIEARLHYLRSLQGQG
jgi:hypothetical protein